jgi:hypothetical protein
MSEHIKSAILDLHRAHLASEQQWSELMTTLALAAARPQADNIDLIAHAADLAYDLTKGVPKGLSRILEYVPADVQVRAAARGRRHLRLIATKPKEENMR